jgi:hypothetical protein
MARRGRGDAAAASAWRRRIAVETEDVGGGRKMLGLWRFLLL